MDNRICFPFTAAVGQNDVREALLLNLIDPSIGGVLIDGERLEWIRNAFAADD